MTKLKYTMTNDLLFKMLFVKYPHLLKRLVALLLGLKLESIEEFIITNPAITPETIGDKFCILDINMIVNEQRINIEVQIKDLGDYPERVTFYWAREFSSALSSGRDYKELPRTIVISIIDFELFACEEYYSEYRLLEVTRHTLLTDKQCLIFFELPKLPEIVEADDELRLWLTLFKAKTEEDLQQIETMEVPVMEQAIGAYRQITATDEFKEMERVRSIARHNEAAALRHAAETAAKAERAKWQVVVAEREQALAEKDAEKEQALAEKDAEKEQALAEKDAEKEKALAEKDAEKEQVLAEKDAQIKELLAQLGKSN